MPRMVHIASFGDTETEFVDPAHTMVWCNIWRPVMRSGWRRCTSSGSARGSGWTRQTRRVASPEPMNGSWCSARRQPHS